MSKSIIDMTPEEQQEYMDDHGYQRCRCPQCHTTWVTDSGDPCPNGCLNDDGEELEPND